MRALVATDLSDASLASLDALCACGPGVFETAVLLHVIDLDLYTAGGSVPQIMGFAADKLGELSARLEPCGVLCSVRVEQGPAVETIEAVALEEGADLVLMTNLGHGGAGRVFGSTAERLAARGVAPVLVERVPGEPECCARSGSPFARVLVCADLEGTLPALLSYVSRLPGETALRVLHVAATTEAAADAETALTEATSGARVEHGLDIKVLVGDPAENIIAEATAWDASVAVVSPCRHSVLHRAVWGSVARGVALHAPCSILFVPPTVLDS